MQHVINIIARTGIFCILICQSFYLYSQEVIAASGEDLVSNNLQLNFTLGQLVNTTESTGSIIITQGFHQIFEEVVATLATPDKIIEINVYPNPTRHQLTISTTESSAIYYTLYDLNGAKVAAGSFKEVTRLPIAHYAKGTYQLFLTNDQEHLLESFKVQFK